MAQGYRSGSSARSILRYVQYGPHATLHGNRLSCQQPRLEPAQGSVMLMVIRWPARAPPQNLDGPYTCGILRPPACSKPLCSFSPLASHRSHGESLRLPPSSQGGNRANNTATNKAMSHPDPQMGVPRRLIHSRPDRYPTDSPSPRVQAAPPATRKCRLSDGPRRRARADTALSVLTPRLRCSRCRTPPPQGREHPPLARF